MMQVLRSRLRSRLRAGTTAVEFALVAPATALLLFGIIEAGRLFWIQNTLQYAAEEGARWAMVNQTAATSDMVAVTRSSLIGLDPATVTITTVAETVDGTSYVTLTTAYPFHYLVPLLSSDPVTVTGSARAPLIP